MKQLLFTVFAVFCITLPNASAQSSIMGFTEEGSKAQLQLETDYDKLIKASNLDEWMKYMSARPHHVGSPYDKKVVDFVAAQFKSWGYEVRIEKFNVYFQHQNYVSLK